MRDADAATVAALVRDRDAWQALALRAIGVLGQVSAIPANMPGKHQEQIDTIERALLLQAIAQCDGKQMKAAEWLGMRYATFKYRLHGGRATVNEETAGV